MASACSAACSAAGFIRGLGNLYDCQLHGSHLCDRNCRSRVWCPNQCATVCTISGRAFSLIEPALSRKRSASDIVPCAVEDESLRKAAAVGASFSATPREACFLRDQTAALNAGWPPAVTTPVTSDSHAKAWDLME